MSAVEIDTGGAGESTPRDAVVLIPIVVAWVSRPASEFDGSMASALDECRLAQCA